MPEIPSQARTARNLLRIYPASRDGTHPESRTGMQNIVPQRLPLRPNRAGRRAVTWPLAGPLRSPGMPYWMVACSVYLYIAILGANVHICGCCTYPMNSAMSRQFSVDKVRRRPARHGH
jgi:hypothetical protein